MATHQEIAGVSDQVLVDRMVNTHDGRFDAQFWQYFQTNIGDAFIGDILLSENGGAGTRIVDLGCGPGLLLRDLRKRYPESELFGYDVTPAMIEYAIDEVKYAGQPPSYAIHDITEGDLPLENNSVDLLIMVAVLHVLPLPLDALAAVKRSLKPGGMFLLHDWIARPLPDYLETMLEKVPADKLDIARQQMFRLFPSHNKYTPDDWLWLLGEAGFEVVAETQLQSAHFRTFVCRPYSDSNQ